MATWGPIGFEAADGWADNDYVDEHGAPWNVNDVTISVDVGLNNPSAGFGVFGSGRLRIDTHDGNSTLVADMSAEGSQVATHTTSLGPNQRILIDEAFPDRGAGYASGNCSIIIQLRCSTNDGGDCYFAVLETAAGDATDGTTHAHIIRVAANAMVESLATTTWTADTTNPFSFQAEIDGSVIRLWAEDHVGESPVAMDGTNLRITYDTSSDGTVLSTGDFGGWGIHRQYATGGGIHGQPYADNITAESLAGGAASASISPATITATAHPVTATPGQAATTYAQAPATVTAHPVTATAGVVAVTVGPAQLTTTAHSVSATASPALVVVSPASVVITAHPVSVVPGAVSRTIAPATTGVTAHPVTATAGIVARTIDPASATITARTVTASATGSASRTIAPVTVTTTSHTVTVSQGVASRSIQPALLSIAAGGPTVTPGVAARTIGLVEVTISALPILAVATGSASRLIGPTSITATAHPVTTTQGVAPRSVQPPLLVITAHAVMATAGPAFTTISPAQITVTADPVLAVAAGSASQAVSPATITATAHPVTVTPGAVSRTIAPATTGVTAHPVTATAGIVARTIQPVTISTSAHSLLVAILGSSTRNISPATASVLALAVTVTPGVAPRSVNPTSAIVTAHPVTATAGIVARTIQPVSVNATAQALVATAGVIPVQIGVATLTLETGPVTATPGTAQRSIVAVFVLVSAGTVITTPEGTIGPIPQVTWTNNLKPYDGIKMDYTYVFASGLTLATAGVLEHAGLTVPEIRIVDIAPVRIPEGGKCGCSGITVGIGGNTSPTDYNNCDPGELLTKFEIRVYVCRASADMRRDQETPRPAIGSLDGLVGNSIHGASLETTRVYMAMRRYLIDAICALEGPGLPDLTCRKFKSVVWGLGHTDNCNYVSASFQAKV